MVLGLCGWKSHISNPSCVESALPCHPRSFLPSVINEEGVWELPPRTFVYTINIIERGRRRLDMHQHVILSLAIKAHTVQA